MKLNATTLLTDFRLYRRFVKVEMPKVASNRFVLRNIQRAVEAFHGDVSLQELRQALKWGQGPEVSITKDLKVNGKPSFTAFNRTTRSIEHDRAVVEQFETGEGLHRFPKGKFYLVGVNLLHELCHWALHEGGIREDANAKLDVGEAFEIITYGDLAKHVQPIKKR